MIVGSLPFFNLSNTVGWRSAQACRPQIFFHKYTDVSVKLPNGNGNGRELGIAQWKKTGM